MQSHYCNVIQVSSKEIQTYNIVYLGINLPVHLPMNVDFVLNMPKRCTSFLCLVSGGKMALKNHMGRVLKKPATHVVCGFQYHESFI